MLLVEAALCRWVYIFGAASVKATIAVWCATLCADRADSGRCLCCDTARVLECAQIEAAFSRRVVVLFFLNCVCCAEVDAFFPREH